MSEYVKMQCQICGHIYDPVRGEGEIPPGTPFDELPDSWVCPICGAEKSHFKRLG